MREKEKEKAAEKKEKKSNAGRPSLYKPEYAEQAYKFCLLGADDKKLAELFDVDERTINRWKIDYPEFCQSIKMGKDIADAEVADRLYQRAMGYEHDDVELKVVSLGNNCGSEVQEVPIRKYYPPDPTAAIFWLKNRQKTNWRDKQDIEALNVNLNSDVSDLTDEQLAEELAKMGFEKK